ncbi:MAG TPA: hypothetical protein VF547_06195, partial [Allosphingosinicella sp.]
AAALAAAAAAAVNPADQAQAPGTIDSFARAVLRRYEPPNAEASTAAVQARSAKPLPAATHWALSGLPQPSATAPAAKPAKPAATAAAPAEPPKCLEGVRRALKGVPAPADKAAAC